jgi:hypothetical protein
VDAAQAADHAADLVAVTLEPIFPLRATSSV